MSIRDDIGLLEKYRECLDAGSMTVKILHDQVTEIVVADLIAKYKHCMKIGDDRKNSFAVVLRYYLTEDEFDQIEGI